MISHQPLFQDIDNEIDIIAQMLSSDELYQKFFSA